MNTQSRPGKEALALLESLRAVSFVTDELRLFLDTHPNDRQAEALFLENANARADLIREYTAKYGAIAAYDPSPSATGWGWTEAPMPWESEAN